MALNEKWMPAIPYLQLMCISALMFPLHSVNINILQIKGRSDILLYLEFLKKIFTALVLYMSIKYGVIGILVGQIIASTLSYAPNSYFSGKLINYPANEQIADFIPNLLASGAVALVIYYAVNTFVLPSYVEFVVFGLLGVIIYIIISYILKLDSFFIIEKLIRGTLKKRA
ncbi:MAG: polysaccharide biosynthesis C-terminal domain-containing protein [Methanolobus sp.]